MDDGLGQSLAIAFGLMLVIEGLAYALFPGGLLRMFERMRNATPGALRAGGLMALAAGVFIVWVAKG